MIPRQMDDRRMTMRRLPGRLSAESDRPRDALERLQRLYEISRLLTAFESVEKTFPAVVESVGKMLPLQSAVLVMKGHAIASTTAWTAKGSSRDVQDLTARAEAAFTYLTAPAERPASHGPGPDRSRLIQLPLVVDHRKTFGILQLEGEVLDEGDLQLANAVANQLAVALRRHDVEAERESLLVSERRARAEAETANRAKDEFLALLSHELRTPLNAMAGWAYLMRDGRLTGDETKKAVDTICRNAGIQTQLIADILDVDRIVSGRLRLERRTVSLGPIIESARDTLAPAANAKQVEVRLDLAGDAGDVAGDVDRLRQVVWNLLSNAIKFTPKGGHVAVALRAADEGHVEVTVSDDGPGIPQEFLRYVFDRFRQADASRSRRHGGLGLGLAIAQKLVTLHDGTITATNAEGGGAVFRVRLPSQAPASAAAAKRTNDEADAEAASLDGVRVLIVDDMPDDRDVLAKILEQHGAEVLTASSAADGLEVLERERPHVLLSDISMPDEDGYAFLRRVRELPADRGGLTPAAAVTAFAGAVERAHTLAAGFQEHVSKPVDSQALAERVAALASRSMRREER